MEKLEREAIIASRYQYAHLNTLPFRLQMMQRSHTISNKILHFDLTVDQCRQSDRCGEVHPRPS